jgi:hypothetical protein
MKLLTQRETTALCAHPALNSAGPDRWQCALCGAELTSLQLLDQRNARREARRQQANETK